MAGTRVPGMRITRAWRGAVRRMVFRGSARTRGEGAGEGGRGVRVWFYRSGRAPSGLADEAGGAVVGAEAVQFLPQLERRQVFPARCPYGCASIEFRIDGQPRASGPMHLMADFLCRGDSALGGTACSCRTDGFLVWRLMVWPWTRRTHFQLHVCSAQFRRRPQAPNPALQRTRSAVTLAASCLHLSPACSQRARSASR